MSNERRYDEDEAARIFRAAATSQETSRSPAGVEGGLTLADLQSIGTEVGMRPDRIAEAAAALDVRRSVMPRRTDLGMPIAVGRTVDLPRAPTDREWALIVSELRRTFSAKGRDSSQGELRSWTNSNLHAYVEPTDTGYQFRIGTLKGDATVVNRLGLGATGIGAMLLGVAAATGVPLANTSEVLLLAGMGVVGLGYNALRLPRWASTRERQMNHMALRVRALIHAPTGEDDDTNQEG